MTPFPLGMRVERAFPKGAAVGPARAWEGKRYTHRYDHKGKWLYCGKWEHHARKNPERKQ